MKVLITGATGLVGRALVTRLLEKGHHVSIFTRNISTASKLLGPQVSYHLWQDYSKLPSLEAFHEIDALVNLMGENIGDGRWSSQRKQKIWDSRVLATQQLAKAVSGSGSQLKVVVSTSAVGFYGHQSDKELAEDTDVSSDFLANLCAHWENSARGIPAKRLAILRLGVVLSPQGGALAKMLPIFKMGLGGAIGGGKQYMSWIHLEDVANLFLRAIEDEQMAGIYNAVSGQVVTNDQFTKTLGKVLRRPTIFPVPSFVLKLAMGEASSIVLDSIRAIPKRLEKEKIDFKYGDLEDALRNLLEGSSFDH